MVQSHIAALLRGNEAVAALVADRVDPVTLPQSKARPNVTYQGFNGQPLSGSRDGPTQIRTMHVQFNHWTNSYADAWALAGHAAALLNGYVGTAGDYSVRIALDDEDDVPLPPEIGKAVGMYGVRQVYKVIYEGV